MKPKILIGVPGFDGIQAEAQQSFMQMVYHFGKTKGHAYDLAVHVVHKKEQFRARNNLVDGAIASGFDYLLMLDDDMIVPHDLISRLLDHDKDVIGVLYYQRGGQYHPVIMERPDKTPGIFTPRFIQQTDSMVTDQRGLYPVDVIGGGCMLFKMHVFDKLLQPYFEAERVVGTDIAICGRLQDAGVDIWCDTSIELGHIGERKIITSRTVPIAERVMAGINQELYEDAKTYLCMHDEEIKSKMVQASSKEARQRYWGDRTESKEDVADYYRQDAEWHILNLLSFNITKNDIYKEWAFSNASRYLTKDSRVLDYGTGLGHVAIPLAKRHGCHVIALDLYGAATLDFVHWRKDRWGLENLDISAIGIDGIMGDYEQKLDGAFCISVLDHLTQPLMAVERIRDQLKPGAFFVCEYDLHSGDDEPQHLNRYDVSKFQQYMHGLGFETSPEHDWLFFYVGG